jgi:hypothetical protein
MFTLWIVWAALAIFVIALALIRKFASMKEDDIVHLSGPEAAISQQVTVARKLDKIDYWGKLLTVVVSVFGVVLAVVTVYNAWQASIAIEK